MGWSGGEGFLGETKWSGRLFCLHYDSVFFVESATSDARLCTHFMWFLVLLIDSWTSLVACQMLVCPPYNVAAQSWILWWILLIITTWLLVRFKRIGHFQVAFHICFKVSPSAKPFIWKLVLFTHKFCFIYMWMKLISIRKALHYRCRSHFETEAKGNSEITYSCGLCWLAHLLLSFL